MQGYLCCVVLRCSLGQLLLAIANSNMISNLQHYAPDAKSCIIQGYKITHVNGSTWLRSCARTVGHPVMQNKILIQIIPLLECDGYERLTVKAGLKKSVCNYLEQ